jgi:hypothetical protein
MADIPIVSNYPPVHQDIDTFPNVQPQDGTDFRDDYHLVITNIAMENHHFE